ncbi:hypothetical protein CRYUN_Cryun09bG0075200 [Craigia yunnanensis]
MEVSITAEDIVRAGGFGARDDLSSFFPLQVTGLTLRLQFVMSETMKNLRETYADQVLAGEKHQKGNSSVFITT